MAIRINLPKIDHSVVITFDDSDVIELTIDQFSQIAAYIMDKCKDCPRLKGGFQC